MANTMIFQWEGPIFEEGVSAVTATNSVAMGSRRFFAGEAGSERRKAVAGDGVHRQFFAVCAGIFARSKIGGCEFGRTFQIFDGAHHMSMLLAERFGDPDAGGGGFPVNEFDRRI